MECTLSLQIMRYAFVHYCASLRDSVLAESRRIFRHCEKLAQLRGVHLRIANSPALAQIYNQA